MVPLKLCLLLNVACDIMLRIDPLLPSCNKYLENLGHNVTFSLSEVELKAMTVQLKSQGITD